MFTRLMKIKIISEIKVIIKSRGIAPLGEYKIHGFLTRSKLFAQRSNFELTPLFQEFPGTKPSDFTRMVGKKTLR